MELKKPYSTNSGSSCAVIGCSNSSKRRHNFGITPCGIHNGRLHMYCGCDYPFQLFSFPTENNELSRMKRMTWIHNLCRKDYHPHKSSVICSAHFKDGKPTIENPYPTLNLGHDRSINEPRKPPLKRINVNKKQMDIPVLEEMVNPLPAVED